ncbi:MAG: holo-ACP synthase [Clostridiales bacterium]|jgi:holo-[acyl-carrier protein] synthase|nr:holo-ACP synthase [Clostridiales bacterium]
MILGIGVDIVEIGRVEAAAQQKRFCERIFTEAETVHARTRPDSLAGMFAAKEAAAKAMGTGFRGFEPKEVEIMHDAFGRPWIRPGGALRKLWEEKAVKAAHVSISHSKSHAVAYVILEGDCESESFIRIANEEN